MSITNNIPSTLIIAAVVGTIGYYLGARSGGKKAVNAALADIYRRRRRTNPVRRRRGEKDFPFRGRIRAANAEKIAKRVALFNRRGGLARLNMDLRAEGFPTGAHTVEDALSFTDEVRAAKKSTAREKKIFSWVPVAPRLQVLPA